MITKQNYETWFFLYADNELSAEEQAMVLDFVSSNPELNSEFESIQQIKFIPEHSVAMPDKEHLKSGDFIQLENIYRLEPDLSVVYPNKKELYRKTSVLSIDKRFSYSAAASVIFMLGIFWWMQRDSTAVQSEIVKSAPVVVESSSGTIKEIGAIQVSKQPRVNRSYPFVKNKISAQVIASSGSIDPSLVTTIEPNKSEIEQEINQPEKVVRTDVKSNFSIEVLEAANERMKATSIEAIAPSPSPNMEALLKASLPEENEGSAFKGLIRKFSRKVLHENDDEDAKVIQVANFHIHVKN